MNLPPEARSIIVGSLLGDGYLYPNGTLQVEHSLDQAAYVFWKYEGLRCIAGRRPTMVERFDPRTRRIYRSIRFYTKALLKEYRSVFYKDRTKVVPARLRELVDPLAMAVWFMDDGGRGAHTPKGLVINTSCYSAPEQLELQSMMAGVFGVEVSIHRVGRGFQLYVRASSFARFRELVDPFLVPQQRYKIPADPVTTSPPRGRDGGLVRDRTIYDRHDTSALTYHP